MIERLVEYVARCTDDALKELTLEDAAVCLAWSMAGGNPGQFTTHEALRSRIDRWCAIVDADQTGHLGQRTQPLLRIYIDILKQDAVYRLKHDELAFLVSTFELTTKAHAPRAFDRVHRLIADKARELKSRLATTTPNPEMPGIAKRIEYTTERDIGNARQRSIRSLSGIEIAFTGPVYSCKGLLKVMGSVPAGSLVHVEDASCVVCGFVMGIVCATMHCQIRNNVAGHVIVRSGEVRCHNIIDKSFVVTKAGLVVCNRALDPRLIFAGSAIRVADSAIGGIYKSRVIEVAHDAVGGEFHVTERMTAANIRPTDSRPCTVLLRSELMSIEYGEPLGKDAIRLLSQAKRLKRRLTLLNTMIGNMHQESEQVAQAALLVICGGDAHVDLMSGLERAERRVNLLNRVLSASHSMLASAEERAYKADAADAEPVPEEHVDAQSDERDLQELFTDIEQSHPEGTGSEKVEELEDLKKFHGLMDVRAKDARPSLTAIGSLRERVARWAKERDELLTRIDKMLSDLTTLMGRMAILERFGDKAARSDILRSVIHAIRTSTGNDALKERLNNPYVRYAITGVMKRTERLERHRKDVEAVQADLERVAAQLDREYLIKFDLGANVCEPTVSGTFETGVVVMSAPAPDTPAHSDVHRIVIAKHETATYRSDKNGAISALPAP